MKKIQTLHYVLQFLFSWGKSGKSEFQLEKMTKRKLKNVEKSEEKSEKIGKITEKIDNFSDFWAEKIDEIGSSQLADIKVVIN